MAKPVTGLQLNKQPFLQIPLFYNPMDTSAYMTTPKDSDAQGRDPFEKEYTEFIDLAAHEMDAPLRKINILISRLTDKYDLAAQHKDVKDYVERIDHSLKEMRMLINDMSALARVAAGTKEYRFCHLDNAVQQVLQDLGGMVESRNAAIHVSPLPVIKGDDAQLRQLFRSLIDNALKFCGKDTTPEIHIRSAVPTAEEKDRYGLDKDKKYYRIEIADNGIGFKAVYAEKIFRPFVRLHGKSQYPGSGIGLAGCRKIAANHGGVIYAESRENCGASFVLILPETR